MRPSLFFIPLWALFMLSACGKEEAEVSTAPPEAVPSPSVAVEPAQMPEGVEVTDLQSGYDIYIVKCISCHGDVGQGVGDNPKLIGLRRADVSVRLTEYRDGKTRSAMTAVMAPAARDLTDTQIAALAGYVGE